MSKSLTSTATRSSCRTDRIAIYQRLECHVVIVLPFASTLIVIVVWISSVTRNPYYGCAGARFMFKLFSRNKGDSNGTQ
jgi:hypothetical protein